MMALSNDTSLQRKICKALEIPIKEKDAQSINKQKAKGKMAHQEASCVAFVEESKSNISQRQRSKS
ncbi:unnamed protein product [Prunus brigantina]